MKCPFIAQNKPVVLIFIINRVASSASFSFIYGVLRNRMAHDDDQWAEQGGDDE